MNEDVLISIIIPVYNAGKFIEQCLNSIQTQTFKQFEVICVDDGSSDDSAQIIQSYCDSDNRFLLVSQNNMGPGPARNKGIDCAKGKYVLFMDPDDWYPNDDVLSTHFDKIEASKMYVAGGSLSFYDSVLNEIIPNKIAKAIFKTESIIEFESYQYDYFFQRYIYSLAFLNNNHIRFRDLRRYQDVIFFLDCMSIAKKIYSYPQPTYVYRGNNRSGSFYTKEKVLAWLQGMCEALIISKKNKWKKIHHKTSLQLTYDNYLEASSPLRLNHDEDYFKMMYHLTDIIDWKFLQSVDYKINQYYVMYKIILGGYFWDLSRMTDSDSLNYTSKIIAKIGVVEFVKALIYNCIGIKDQMFPVLHSISRNHNSKKIKTIGIFNESINVGGVERYISQIIPILHNMGYSIVLFTESDPTEDKFQIDSKIPRVVIPGKHQNSQKEWIERVDILVKAILQYKVDLFYYNSYWKENIVFDAIICNQICRIPFVIHHHNVFSAMLARNNDFFFRAWEYYSFADCMVTLSRVDCLYFRIKGIPAIYIPNPSNYFQYKPQIRTDNKIIWVGRFVPNHKQPIEALKVMKNVIRSNQNAILYMLGDGDDSVKNELYDYVKDNGLSNNVVFKGFVQDMINEYATASVMLMTSCIEGFPMAVAECKSQGLPLVAYDLPYVEMIRDRQGVIIVPQGDYAAAADSICRLLSNKEKLSKMSNDALKSLSAYNDDYIEEQWIKMLDSLELSDYKDISSVKAEADDLTILVNTLSYHSQLSKNADRKKMINKVEDSSTRSNLTLIGKLKSLLFKQNNSRVQSVSKFEEMLLDDWKSIDSMGIIKADLILNAGIGSKIKYQLSVNKKNCHYHLPLDDFGEYDLDTILKLLTIGTDSLFEEYEIIDESDGYSIVRDKQNNIVSRKQFKIDKQIEDTRHKILESEQEKICALKSKIETPCNCSIIMCNRGDYKQILSFAKSLSSEYNNINLSIFILYNYPELNKDIVYKSTILSDKCIIYRIAMNDNGEIKWRGNSNSWAKLLKHISI